MALVATRAEADAGGVGRLWTGDDRKKLQRILDALINAEIPFHSRELLKSKALPWISILFWRFMKPRSTFEFHIDVFPSDMARAEEILQQIAKEDDLDFGTDEE